MDELSKEIALLDLKIMKLKNSLSGISACNSFEEDAMKAKNITGKIVGVQVIRRSKATQLTKLKKALS